MKLDDLKLGHVYKVFDSRLNNALVHAAARFDSIEKRGNKFTLVNTPTEKPVWFKTDELQYLTFVKSSIKFEI